ncbi:hypothetical protein BDZ45DRAFT_743157 [Acephala macrosclerotiorum]|nr:hypothetical protein BDZ45DRAFT_743157 [Acephala macrosclerotiorum]
MEHLLESRPPTSAALTTVNHTPTRKDFQIPKIAAQFGMSMVEPQVYLRTSINTTPRVPETKKRPLSDSPNKQSEGSRKKQKKQKGKKSKPKKTTPPTEYNLKAMREASKNAKEAKARRELNKHQFLNNYTPILTRWLEGEEKEEQ